MATTEWIESMNTVMDDNKMLTLASNERIPLTPTMRLLLEINHMVHCSPATVSRGGVIFVNAEDVGWRPAVDSWIERLEVRPGFCEPICAGCVSGCSRGCACIEDGAGSGRQRHCSYKWAGLWWRSSSREQKG